MSYQYFDSLLDGVLVIDEQAQVVYSNETAGEICGASAKRMLSNNSLSHWLSAEEEMFPDGLLSIDSSTSYREIHYKNSKGKDGVLQFSIQPSFENNHWILFLREVSAEIDLVQKYYQEQKIKARVMVDLEDSKIDHLTQILNRKSFSQEFEKVFEISRKKGFQIFLMLFDLDHFKKINDDYGHLAGDYVLTEVASIVKANLRRSFLFARYGGEEFVILVDRGNIECIAGIAENIRKIVADHKFEFEGQVMPVTFSAGYGGTTAEMKSPEEIFQKVDEALYVSKNNGRNQVTAIQVDSTKKSA